MSRPNPKALTRASASAPSSPAACAPPLRGVVVCGPPPVVYVAPAGGGPLVTLGGVVNVKLGPGRRVRR